MTPKPSYDELYQKVKASESKTVLATHALPHFNDEIHTRLDHPEAFADIIQATKKWYRSLNTWNTLPQRLSRF